MGIGYFADGLDGLGYLFKQLPEWPHPQAPQLKYRPQEEASSLTTSIAYFAATDERKLWKEI